MSDNQTTPSGKAWQGADLVTVNGYGTVADIVAAVTDGGDGSFDDLRFLWEGQPEILAFGLAREIMRRDAEFEKMVQETISENADLGQRLAEAEQTVSSAIESFDRVEEHYNLALTVVEAARAFVMSDGDDASIATIYDDLVASVARFDGFEGPVQVDAMAGGRAAVSAVPPYQGDDLDQTGVFEEDGEEVHSRPALSIVPDQD